MEKNLNLKLDQLSQFRFQVLQSLPGNSHSDQARLKTRKISYTQTIYMLDIITVTQIRQ